MPELHQASFELRVPLMSKARPRTPRRGGRPYTPEAYRQWLATTKAVLSEWWTVAPLPKVTVIHMLFRGPARGDLDNLAGAVLDAGKGVVWLDDRVTVVPCLALRFHKVRPADASINLRVIWQ